MELSPFELVHSVLWLYMAHERSFKHVFSRANCWTTRGSVAYFPYIFSSTWINDELINEGGWVNTYEHLWNYHMRESPSSKTNYDWMGTLSTVPAPGDPLGNVWWPIAGCSRVPFTKAVRVVHKHVLWYVPVFFQWFLCIYLCHVFSMNPNFTHISITKNSSTRQGLQIPQGGFGQRGWKGCDHPVPWISGQRSLVNVYVTMEVHHF